MAGRLFCLVILSSCFQLSLSRILLFWAVDSSERTQETVQANVEHVKNLGIDHDVILAHYRGSRRDWDQKWYSEHVTKSLSGMGFKFHFLQRAYKAGDWEERYEFVWALDSDIDLSKADLGQFLEMARQINSAIVGPTFVEKGMSLVHLQDGSGSVIRREGHSPKRHNSHHGHQLSGPNKIQVPNPGCDFRHTDFVELTAPLLKSAVLRSILVDCKHCIHEKSDWGLDMMWCKYLSERLGEQGCALVDKTPVVHLDWGLAPVSSEFYVALHAVQAKYGNYWSQHRVLDCKRQEAGLVENIAEETVQDTSTKRKSTKRVKKKTHPLSAETRKKGGSADASRRENPNERDSQQEGQEDLNDDEEVVDGDGEESVNQDREEGQLDQPKPERKAAREQAETEEEEDSMNKPQEAAKKKTSEQQETVSNTSSEATEKIQPAEEAKTTVTDEDEEEAEEDQEESSESSESSDSKIRSNVTSASSANTSSKQAVSNSSSEATQKVTDEDEEEAEEDQEESSESSESSETSDSKIRSNVTSASSANTSSKQAVSNSSSEATQKVTDEDEEAGEVDEEESSESSESSDSKSKIRSNVTNSQGSKSSEEDESKQDESEPASEGIFKVKAKAPRPDSHHSLNDAVFDDGAQPQKAPGLPTHLDGKMAVLGTVAGPKEPAIQLSSVDAKGHVEPLEVEATRRASPWHSAKLEESFKEAELRLRDDIKQLRELEEEFKLSTERESEAVATKRSERKHYKKRRAKTHKHSAIQKAVSLIDMEEHQSEKPRSPDQNQDSPSLQIKALAAGARQVAMEVAEEVQNTVGSMSSEQLQSTRNAALQSVQAAITEQVETQELHKDKPNANRHEVSLAHKIRELEAQVAWDQKQMEHQMEEELGLKNELKHIEGELRARKIASNMAVKDPQAKTTHAQRTEETGKMHKKKSQHQTHGVKLANHRKQG